MPADLPRWQEPRPALAVELTGQQARILAHYRRCKAVNWQVPDAADPLVQYHAALIRAAEDLTEQSRLPEAVALAVVQLLPKGRGNARSPN